MSIHSENHLKNEKSPYLKQHAENPVDWYPWSVEALERAKRDDKPLIVSIGYSTCHWCHVMERESFEDEETVRIMNENFVNIKVDREERPDLDSLYMKAVQAMTGHAGWPLTVFATPEGVPFYGGSYFPPQDKFGLPSFRKVLMAVSLAYRKNKKRVDAIISDVEEALRQRIIIAPVELTTEVSDNAFDAARLFFDPVNGGFGRGTKFPYSMFLKFLTKFFERTSQQDAMAMIKKSINSMASGGVYDHVGGGFHRYAVDEAWSVPHFEKMLYDNALLAELYSEAYGATGLSGYKQITEETIGYMLRELRSPQGGFYSAEDADVEGVEGAFYLWEYGEIEEALGKKKAQTFAEFYSVTKEGNYEEAEGKNVLRVNTLLKKPDQPVPEDILHMRRDLFGKRTERARPGKDRKIITAWNGLAVKSLVKAGAALKRPQLIDEAKKTMTFLIENIKDDKGRVLRYYLDGKSGVKGNLEDYALLGAGLFSIYEATGDRNWLDEANNLTDDMIELFYDEEVGLFYDIGTDQEKLFVRERDLFDNDVPSGNSAAADLLFRMSRVNGGRRYRELSEEILRSAEGIMDEPLSYGNFLTVIEDILGDRTGQKKAH